MKTDVKLYWSSGEVAKERGCTVHNVNRVLALHPKLRESKYSTWIGGRRLYTRAGLDFILALPTKRGRPSGKA